MKLIIDVDEKLVCKGFERPYREEEQDILIKAIWNGTPVSIEEYDKGLQSPCERPQGEWEYNQYDGNPNIGNWHCSECRHIISGKYSQYPNYNFCPNCGAKMKQG